MTCQSACFGVLFLDEKGGGPMQDPPPEDPADDANMTFADLLEETANDVSSKIEAAADAAAKEEAPAAAKEEAR